MDVRFLELFYFEKEVSSFFFKLVTNLVKSPLLESNRFEIPENLKANLTSTDWQASLNYGAYSFGRMPHDSSPKPDISYHIDDSRVSRRAGWFIYLPMEELAVFIKNTGNTNTVFVNDHACNFSLLQNNSKIHLPKDKSHEIVFTSLFANSYSYEDIPYIFGHKKSVEYIYTEPESSHIVIYYSVGSFGRGCSGKTYIAFDATADRLVTLKKFDLDISSYDDKKSLFRNIFQDYRLFQIERQSFVDGQNLPSAAPTNLEQAGSIAHLNLTQVTNIHFLIEKQKTFLCRANEYTPSISLAKYIEVLRLNNRSMPLLHFKNIIYQLIIGLYYLHSRGITHGNLCPEKILLVPYPFGTLVKIRDYPLNEKPYFINTDAFKQKYDKQKFHFQAPELSDFNTLKPEMDIFSLGNICYYMLTFSILFGDISDFTSWQKQYEYFTQKEKIQLKLQSAKISNNFISLILNCLNIKNNERPSLHDLYTAIEQLKIENI